MPELFLIGDSHARVIRSGLVARGWSVFGGMIGAGKEFEAPFFTEVGGRVKFNSESAQEVFSRALEDAGASRLDDLRIPIVSTLGFNSHRLARLLWQGDRTLNEDYPRKWSSAVLDAIVSATRGPVVDFYRLLPRGLTLAVLCPLNLPVSRRPLALCVEQILIEKLAPYGVQIVSVRDQTHDAAGNLRPEFQSTERGDRGHGNHEFGLLVAERLIGLISKAGYP